MFWIVNKCCGVTRGVSLDAEQSTERLLTMHMVLVVHVEGLCAEVRCVGMGGGDGHDRSALSNLNREKEEEEER